MSKKQKIIISISIALLILIGWISAFLSFNNKEEEKSKKQIPTEKIEKIKEEDFELKENTKDIKDMDIDELNNNLYEKNGGNNLNDKIKKLTSTGSKQEDIEKSAYLNSFIGNYENALKQRDEICNNSSTHSNCEKIDLKITSYVPSDMEGNIISNTELFIDWEKIWELKGNNEFSLYNNFVHRVRVHKKWYLDFYKKIALSSYGSFKESINPKLLKADSLEIINASEELSKETENFSFKIEGNSFSYADWTEVSGEIELYFFDIDGSEGNLNVFNLDAFDEEDFSYAGGSMITHGMPLVKAYSGDKELAITKPILGKWIIIHQEKAIGMDLKNVPKNVWLTKKEADKYKIPPFWRLDMNARSAPCRTWQLLWEVS